VNSFVLVELLKQTKKLHQYFKYSLIKIKIWMFLGTDAFDSTFTIFFHFWDNKQCTFHVFYYFSNVYHMYEVKKSAVGNCKHNNVSTINGDWYYFIDKLKLNVAASGCTNMTGCCDIVPFVTGLDSGGAGLDRIRKSSCDVSALSSRSACLRSPWPRRLLAAATPPITAAPAKVTVGSVLFSVTSMWLSCL